MVSDINRMVISLFDERLAIHTRDGTMRLKLRHSLVGILCICFSGLLISYKSFQLHNASIRQDQQNHNLETSQWVAQSVEQKLTNLESAVAYLDKSTVESLKRLGARYFAYAYEQKGEWKLKWKTLGAETKKQILAEIDLIPLQNIPRDKRTWRFNKKNKAIYISPAELAESHQLKSGLLIFGLKEDFFTQLSILDHNTFIYQAADRALYNQIVGVDLETLLAGKQKRVYEIIDVDQGESLYAGYFSPISQLWYLRVIAQPNRRFSASSFLSLYLLISVLAAVLFTMLVFLRDTFRVTSRLKNRLAGSDSLQNELNYKNIAPIDNTKQVVKDFEQFIDDLLIAEYGKLQKLDISLQTKVADHIHVVCRPQSIRDFILRLIGDSVLSLENAEKKQIQIELVEQQATYQFIYLDTRDQFFPNSEAKENTIDHIISDAKLLFGEALTIAKEGFCLSIDLEKETPAQTPRDAHFDQGDSVLPFVESIERIEINDEDMDPAVFDSISTVRQGEGEDEELLQKSSNNLSEVADLMESFELKDLSFKNEKQIQDSDTDTAVEDPANVDKTQDDNGLVELDTGAFKLKIRSPKKRQDDVDR